MLWRDGKIARVVPDKETARFRLYAGEGCGSVPSCCCDEDCEDCCCSCDEPGCSGYYNNDELATMVIEYGSCRLETANAHRDWLLSRLTGWLRELADTPSLPDGEVDALLLSGLATAHQHEP